MRFKTWLRTIKERTLYHGTIVDNEPSIRQYGLQGGWADPKDTFVGHAYDADYDAANISRTEKDDIVFMADKQAIQSAINGMTFHIARKLGKNFHDVTNNDIRNHGLLVIIKDPEDSIPQYDPNDRRWAYEDPPRGVEDGDYFTQSASGDIFLHGAALIRFLKRNRHWPQSWNKDDPETERYQRGLLGRVAVQRVTDRPKQDVLDTIKNADIKSVQDQMKRWKLT